MRHEKEMLLKEELCVLAIQTRERLSLTQKGMSRCLAMSESYYSDIATGRAMCSTLITILLLEMQEYPPRFPLVVKDKFEKQYEKEIQTV
ncbi:MAG: hypothetical protein E7661_01685 [Ruminococcaceae bacterium]|nr:hypothetical protein [Oscillospiraceae bacterium]